METKATFRWVLVATVLAMCVPVGAATFYVDVNRSGAGSGSSADPYKSVAAAVSAANAADGNTVLVADGSYSAAPWRSPGTRPSRAATWA